MAKAVKLADIAERVGVSTVTVSKALSGQKGVSEEVREKIRSIAEELGYQQPSAARKSQNQKSYNIGILISERFLDKYESFYWQMYQSVATRATAKECFTMLEVIGMSEEENGRMPKLVQERKVDGIIVIGKMMDDYLQHLNTEAGIPVIYLDYYNGREASDSVISNSYYGTYELTYYLYRMGHRKIAYIHGDDTSVTKNRLGSFYRTLQRLGIEEPDEYVKPSFYRDADLAGERTGELLDLKDPPTCILYPDDYAAMGGINEIRERGLRIPEDISVAGYDGINIAQVLEPKLTTLCQDTAAIGRIAAERLIELIEHPKTTVIEKYTVDGTLFKGASVKTLYPSKNFK